jgi:hypothetical protein
MHHHSSNTSLKLSQSTRSGITWLGAFCALRNPGMGPFWLIPGGRPINILEGSLFGSTVAGVLTARCIGFLGAGGGTPLTEPLGDVVVECEGDGDMPQRLHIQPPALFVSLLAPLLDVADPRDTGRGEMAIVERRSELLS